jgi:hypothetical protein
MLPKILNIDSYKFFLFRDENFVPIENQLTIEVSFSELAYSIINTLINMLQSN